MNMQMRRPSADLFIVWFFVWWFLSVWNQSKSDFDGFEEEQGGDGGGGGGREVKGREIDSIEFQFEIVAN